MKGKWLIMIGLGALLSACASEDRVGEDQDGHVEVVEPSEPPFDLDEGFRSNNKVSCLGKECERGGHD